MQSVRMYVTAATHHAPCLTTDGGEGEGKYEWIGTASEEEARLGVPGTGGRTLAGKPLALLIDFLN